MSTKRIYENWLFGFNPPPQAKMYIWVKCGKQRLPDCAYAQSAQGLRYPQTESESKCPDETAHVQDDVTPNILRMFEGTFSLDASQEIYNI